MLRDDDLNDLLRQSGSLHGLAREVGQGKIRGRVPSINSSVPIWREALRAVLCQDATDTLFVVLTALLLAWFVWTLL